MMPVRPPCIASSSRVISSHVTRRKRLFRHAYATVPDPSPSPKICAVPFKQTPAAAYERLFVAGLLATGTGPEMLQAVYRRFIGDPPSWLKEIFGWTDRLNLNNMRAVLYPIWRCDGIFNGKLRLTDNDEERDAFLTVEDTHVPGNAFAPLSYLSFACSEIDGDHGVYDPATDLQQLPDFDVVPVPFTVTPFGLLDRLRKIMGTRVEGNGYTVNVSTWTDRMLACYPIMMPIYIAEFSFTYEKEERTFQVIIDAAEGDIKKCRVSIPAPPDYIKKCIENDKVDFNWFIRPQSFLSSFTLGADGDGPFSREVTPGPDLLREYDAWMAPVPTSPESVDPSPLVQVEEERGTDIDWSDPRIQAWPPGVTRAENQAYLASYSSYRTKKKATEAVKRQMGDDSGTVVRYHIGFGKFDKDTLSTDLLKETMEEEVRMAQKAMEGTKPAWLKEYDQKMGRSGASTPKTEKKQKQGSDAVAMSAQPSSGESVGGTEGKAKSVGPPRSTMGKEVKQVKK